MNLTFPAYPGDGESGASAALEHIKALPILLVCLAFLGLLDRASTADIAVHQAAAASARAATLARTSGEAADKATTAARRSLDEQGIRCEPAATVSIGGDMRPGGTYTARVSCTVSAKSSLLLIGSVTKTDTATSFIDPYRSGG